MEIESGNETLDIETLGYYVNRAFIVLVKNLNKELKARGLNLQHSHFAILMSLISRNGMSQSDLSKYLGREPSGISRAVDHLEKLGYVERKIFNGCTNSVYLTQQGKDLKDCLFEIAHQIQEKALKGFKTRRKREIMEDLTLIFKNSF